MGMGAGADELPRSLAAALDALVVIPASIIVLRPILSRTPLAYAAPARRHVSSMMDRRGARQEGDAVENRSRRVAIVRQPRHHRRDHSCYPADHAPSGRSGRGSRRVIGRVSAPARLMAPTPSGAQK